MSFWWLSIFFSDLAELHMLNWWLKVNIVFWPIDSTNAFYMFGDIFNVESYLLTYNYFG